MAEKDYNEEVGKPSNWSMNDNVPQSNPSRGIGRGLGRGRGRGQFFTNTSNFPIEQPNNVPSAVHPSSTREPRFIPPADLTPSTSKAPTEHSTTSKKGNEKLGPVWSSNVSASRAPSDSRNEFIQHQKALREEAERHNQKKVRTFKEDDHEDSDKEDLFDSPHGSPTNEKSILRKLYEDREREAEQKKAHNEYELIAEGKSLNPGMPADWIETVLSLEERERTVFPNQHDITGSNVPIAPMQDTVMWMDRIQHQWDMNAGRSGLPTLQCFSTSPNPYLTTLYLVENSKDFSKNKTSTLASQILKDFERWIGQNWRKYQHCLDPCVRVHAFYMATRGQMAFLDMSVKCFDLCHEGNGYLLPFVRMYVLKQQYKEAAATVAKLRLQNFFDIREIALPLLFQDKINLVETYVFRNQEQQVALLTLLDQMVRHEDEVPLMLGNCDVPKIQREKLSMKLLTKLAVRLMKLYQVPSELCPNIMREKGCKALRYLMYKKYVENTIDADQWEELVRSSVEGNVTLQYYLVDQLMDYLDPDTGARFALYFELDGPDLPTEVRQRMQQPENYTPIGHRRPVTSDQSSGPADPSAFHPLSMPLEAVMWVEDRDGFSATMGMLAEAPGGVVGLDAEWRPCFGESIVTRMALLQLATTENIFLLDMLALAELLTEDDWAMFADQFFANPNIIKLGYSIDSDLQMMVKTFPSMKKGLRKMEKVVDLQMLHHQISKRDPEFFESSSDESSVASSTESGTDPGRGLGGLVRLTLGKPLNKQEQMSDWERRPLRPEQMHYAALDAYCLVEVYSVLSTRVLERQLDIDLVPQTTMSAKSKKTRNERKQLRVADRSKMGPGMEFMKNQTEVPNAAPRSGPPLRPGDFRVVCDNMLQGLGRQLRCCGVDVVVLENSDDHDVCAKIARKDNRVILTSGLPFITLRSHVAEGMCYNVAQAKAKDQCSNVLQHYNVVVSQDDIFSRCQACNGNKYLFVSNSELWEAWHRKQGIEPIPPLKYANPATGPQFPPANQFDAMDINESKRTWNRETSGSGGVYSAQEQENFVYDHIDMGTLCVGDNVPLQVEKVPQPMFEKIETFYVCATCGKIFWEGSHFDRVCQQFEHVIEHSGTGGLSTQEKQEDGFEISFE